jgi:uncharacterized protein (DUF58 family)
VKRRYRPPRRLRLHRSGWLVTVGAVLLGTAAIGTGNNLLFLLLGAILGFITLSGLLSEQVLRGVEVHRRAPRGATAGEPVTLGYELINRKRRLPSLSLEIGEMGRAARGFLAVAAAGERVAVRVEEQWARRGVHALEGVTLATSFPFGLFRKERDLVLPGEVVVRPRTDRAVPEPNCPAGEQRPQRGSAAGVAAHAARGEYRSLREYRVGDDVRDVHWRTTARRGVPVVREYERDPARTLWLCLDLRAPVGDAAAEVAIEEAAAHAARATARGEPVALVTADVCVAPGAGPAQLGRILDALARAQVRPDAPPPAAPLPLDECVWIAP